MKNHFLDSISTSTTVNRLVLAVLAAVMLSCGTPARQLVSLAVQPSNADVVLPGGTVAFTAAGTFDRAPMTESNIAVQWTSSDSSVVTIDSTGHASCNAEGGPISIDASAAGKSGTVTAVATMSCRSAPPTQGGFARGYCDVGTDGKLTGSCHTRTTDPGFPPNHSCRVTSDPTNCVIGTPAITRESASSGCLPPSGPYEVDTSTACY